MTPDFAGMRVAAFESRRALEMSRLIEKFHGVPTVSPSMREVALADQRGAIDFAHRLISGQIDIVLLLTGGGTRQLLAQVERHVDRTRFLNALTDAITIVRGPKPLAALRAVSIEPTFRVPEPNTWREVLQTFDEQVPVANQVVALQEYGLPNTSLIAGLEARGAQVCRVQVYRYDFPEDVGPLEGNLRAIADGQIDVALFTSAHQALNLLRLADTLGLADDLRHALRRVVVGSIGPTTSETLRECELPVDLEPEHPKMGHLVQTAAERAAELRAAKRRGPTAIGSAPAHSSVGGSTRGDAAAAAAPGEPWYDGPFMKACRREPADRVPIWLMRQAGRYMAEYRAVREKTTFLELCKSPELCAEVMITAVGRLGVDAAIIFSDLLPILEPMGLDLEFARGEGPVIHNPVRCSADVDRVAELVNLEPLDFVMETVRLTRSGIAPDLPVIGFAGAPFTLASYVIEGGASRNYLHTKTLMYTDEGAFHALMARLARAVARYLNAQIEAGAQAVQLFDSWVGCLAPADYRRYVLPHTKAVIDGITPGTPLIHFGTGNPALLPLQAEAGGQVVGVDWRIGLDEAWRLIGYDRAIQGNLDPLVLFSTPDDIRRRAWEIVRQAGGRAGHIFNLGHGILPQTPVENVIALVEAVHEAPRRAANDP